MNHEIEVEQLRQTYGDDVLTFLEAQKDKVQLTVLYPHLSLLTKRITDFNTFQDFINYCINENSLLSKITASRFNTLLTSFFSLENNKEKELIRVDDEDENEEQRSDFDELLKRAVEAIKSDTGDILVELREDFTDLFSRDYENQTGLNASIKTYEIIDALDKRKVDATESQKEQYEELKNLLLRLTKEKEPPIFEMALHKYKWIIAFSTISLFTLLLLAIAWRI